MAVDFIGAGWRYPLETDPQGGFALAGGVAKIEQAMRLVLTTYPGERPMRPEFGSRLRDHVFGPASVDSAAAVSHEVRRALTRWEPRVDVTAVHTYPAGEGTLFHIDIHYTVKATNDERNLVFPFYLIPEDEGDL